MTPLITSRPPRSAAQAFRQTDPGQLRITFRLYSGRYAGKLQNSGNNIDRRTQRLSACTLHNIRMPHDEVDPRILLVHVRSLLPQLMGSRHFSVIGRQNDNGVIRQARMLQGQQDLLNRLVNITDAVQVIALQPLPGLFIARIKVPVDMVAQRDIRPLGPGFTRKVLVVEALRQGQIPVLLIQPGIRPGGNRPQKIAPQA